MILGRDTAAEAAFSPLQTTVLSTPAVLGCSLLMAALGGWYCVHAYSGARATVRGTAAKAAEATDSPLPPLPRAQMDGRDNEAAPARGYAIGDILNPDNDPTGAPAEAGSADRSELARPAEPAIRTPGTARQPPDLRRLDGAVFTRPSNPIAEPLPIRLDHPNSGNSAGSATDEPSSVNRLLRSEVTPATAAAVLPTQRLLLPKGAFLDCTLETAIDSTLPGLTTCITAFDTFSADGTVVLLERGTKLIGEMRSQVQQGTARVFVLWTEARTPNGIVVALASPGTDALGRSGLPGIVDRHFADRFGAAILVSMIGGAIQSVVNRSQQQGDTVILNPTGAGDVATEILRSTLSIPPTVRIAQGERIEVLVARDLDFRTVYSLHAR